MMLDLLEQGIYPNEHFGISIHRELESVYVIIISHTPGIREEIARTLSTLNLQSTELGTVYVNTSGTPCLGYIYCCDDHYKQEHFCGTIQHILEVWSQNQVVSAK